MTDGATQVRHAEALAVRTVTWLRDEEARPVQRTLDHTWTKLAYDSYLPCTGQAFLAASGAVGVPTGRLEAKVPSMLMSG